MTSLRQVIPGIEAPSTDSANLRPVAPLWHTAILIAIIALIAIVGAASRHSGDSGPASATVSLIPLYLSLLAAEWGLLRFTLKGSGMTDTTLTDLIGHQWSQRRGLLRDVMLGVALWAAWEMFEFAWTHFFGAAQDACIQHLLPRDPIEITLWIAVSLSAGFCEEVVFRGYCTRQFAALTHSRWLGLLLQAVLFGMAHGYEGVQACIRITLYGALFGLLANWRKSLRPGMVGHALTDIVAGIFAF